MEIIIKGATIAEILKDIYGKPHPAPHLDLTVNFEILDNAKRLGITFPVPIAHLQDNDTTDILLECITKFENAFVKYCEDNHMTFRNHDQMMNFLQLAVQKCIEQYNSKLNP